ncbi:17919_t:CDS:2, partial [Gigaspora rosea]
MLMIAGGILVYYLHATVNQLLSVYIETVKGLYSKECYEFLYDNCEEFENFYDHFRDYELDYNAVNIMMTTYLLRDKDGKIIELPQFMFLREAIATCDHDSSDSSYYQSDLNSCQATFDYLSERYYTHATPTIINGCLLNGQLSSSFVMAMDPNERHVSISECAEILNDSGGVSISIHNLSLKYGVINVLKIMDELINDCSRESKRKSALAVYVSDYHMDIEEILDAKRKDTNIEKRTYHLFYALWLSDLFLKRVMNNEQWSLFDPKNEYEFEFERKYVECEKAGGPYLLAKDTINKRSNQMNIGLVISSNYAPRLCSILRRVVDQIVKNLNNVIDRNYYPVFRKTESSNLKHRPLGIGVSGLADVFAMMGMAWSLPKARILNRQIFETIYYQALVTSNELAAIHGPYDSYYDSPISKGLFQFDLAKEKLVDPLYNWDELRTKISEHGVRNSMLIQLMPTTSTHRMQGFSEGFEPYYSNLLVHRNKDGEISMVNRCLETNLKKLGLWDQQMRNDIVSNNGSVRNINRIPKNIKEIYKLSSEIDWQVILEMTADRGKFVCGSQSMNLFLTSVDPDLTEMIFYAWMIGCKTLMYYLRMVLPNTNSKPEEYVFAIIRDKDSGLIIVEKRGPNKEVFTLNRDAIRKLLKDAKGNNLNLIDLNIDRKALRAVMNKTRHTLVKSYYKDRFFRQREFNFKYEKEDLLAAIRREILEETGVDIIQPDIETRYLGNDEKLREKDKITTHVFYVEMSVSKYKPWSPETESYLTSCSIDEINQDSLKPEEERIFTPTIHNMIDKAIQHS